MCCRDVGRFLVMNQVVQWFGGSIGPRLIVIISLSFVGRTTDLQDLLSASCVILAMWILVTCLDV